ncbi:hypothetical protein [Limosilactobacillus reuteri]|uniref:ABC transporter permease n=1 Tax=Limosilactobacillus reuteri TaxID=1598 RepID=A0AAX2SR70_LIMRT|nr:hypothetical protein [Limosilactobacillus reuteri]RMX25834.1 hypothetical protein C6H63_08665 [Limosilactobacillus reuteri]TGB09763.1 hypothetical protein E5F87_09700 [Limosilactobacillus reuteri]
MKTWIKLLVLGKNDTYRQFSTYIWIVISLIIFILYTKKIIKISIPEGILLTSSIAGLSFTIAVFSVMSAAVSQKSLIYYAKFAISKKNRAFFETFANFIWVALLFTISFFIATISILLNTWSLIGYIKILNISVISLAVFSMFELVIDVVWQAVSNVESQFNDNKNKFLDIFVQKKKGEDVTENIKEYLRDINSTEERSVVLEILIYLEKEKLIERKDKKYYMLTNGESLVHISENRLSEMEK